MLFAFFRKIVSPPRKSRWRHPPRIFFDRPPAFFREFGGRMGSGADVRRAEIPGGCHIGVSCDSGHIASWNTCPEQRVEPAGRCARVPRAATIAFAEYRSAGAALRHFAERRPAHRPLLLFVQGTWKLLSRASVIAMCPGACPIANGGLDCITAACGVTPQAQNTGISPGRISTGSP